jgi:hypothetical protein
MSNVQSASSLCNAFYLHSSPLHVVLLLHDWRLVLQTAISSGISPTTTHYKGRGSSSHLLLHQQQSPLSLSLRKGERDRGLFRSISRPGEIEYNRRWPAAAEARRRHCWSRGGSSTTGGAPGAGWTISTRPRPASPTSTSSTFGSSASPPVSTCIPLSPARSGYSCSSACVVSFEYCTRIVLLLQPPSIIIFFFFLVLDDVRAW